MSAERLDVLVVGAGAAGLAAAHALSSVGVSVRVLERKPYVGGRAYSYPHPALGEVIDSQHVLLGCCTNLVDLCRRSGADAYIRWYDGITFLEPATGDREGRRSVIGPGVLPAPAHSSWSFWRAPMLSLADKTRIAAGLLEFMRGVPASDEESFAAWLRRTHQSERAIRHFWEPIVVSTLNDGFERCSTRYAAQVFYESLLKSREGGRFGIPTQPLSEFYAHVAQSAQAQGADLHLRSSVERIEQTPSGEWQATTAEGEQHRAAQMLLALPFEAASRLLATLPANVPQQARLRTDAEHFGHAPITTIHVWFERPVTDLDHAALLDTRIQWMFNKSKIRRAANSAKDESQYLELVISASFPELQLTREQILQPALEELARFFPEVRKARVLKSGVLKEARATFSVVPGLDAFRPEAGAPGGGLFLAGDWTRTEWPSTMEGAVRSGRLAAEAICISRGSGERCLTQDLPADGLMRLLAKRRT